MFAATHHKDCGDILAKEWAEFLTSQLEALHSDSGQGVDQQKYYTFFKRYQAKFGFKKFYKATTCAWASLRKPGSKPRAKDAQQVQSNSPENAAAYYQWFILDSLGVAHNISSPQLEHKDIGGVYGASFLSGYVAHASSLPVGLDENDCVWLIDFDNDSIPMPLAWGK